LSIRLFFIERPSHDTPPDQIKGCVIFSIQNMNLFI